MCSSDLLRSWAKITGTYLAFDTAGKSVSLSEVRGRELGVGFRWRRNVKSIRRRAAPPEVTTLYAYGADDLTIKGVNGGEPYVEDFTYYTNQGLTLDEARERFTRSRVWYDSEFVSDSELPAGAEARLALLAQPVIAYELAVVDLSDLIVPDDERHIVPGDTVRVVDDELGHDIRTTVTRTLKYPNEPHRNQVELSYIVDPVGDGSESQRPDSAEKWVQYVGRVGTTYQIRNGGAYVVGRIPLRYREGGKGNWHVDIAATGVGSGNMLVEVLDYTDDPAGEVFRTVTVPYTDGVECRAFLSWAHIDQTGPVDYRVRVTPTGDVDVTADRPDEASFYVMVQGAVRESPSADNSVTYNYVQPTNPFGSTALDLGPALQEFIVPDNVEEVSVELAGAEGGRIGGGGAIVYATFQVVPGSIYDVVIGGAGTDAQGAGWPNGGGGGGEVGSSGGGGGASSAIGPAGMVLNIGSALMVAAGGGGGGQPFQSFAQAGGMGGLFLGLGGDISAPYPGGGGTQTAGGAAGANATAGAYNQGGDAAEVSNFFSFPPGGGGGGYYGGGGGGSANASGSNTGGGGGGGSSYVNQSAGPSDITGVDGGNAAPTEDAAYGYCTISWEDPL